MDQATLVREQVDGGEKLVRRLRAEGLDVSGACWAKTADDGQWYLYLVSPEVEGKDPRPGYLRVRETLRRMDGGWAHPLEQVDPFDVKLIGTSDPMARWLASWYQGHPDDRPTWVAGPMSGSLSLEGGYVYPASMFAHPQPTS